MQFGARWGTEADNIPSVRRDLRFPKRYVQHRAFGLEALFSLLRAVANRPPESNALKSCCVNGLRYTKIHSGTPAGPQGGLRSIIRQSDAKRYIISFCGIFRSGRLPGLEKRSNRGNFPLSRGKSRLSCRPRQIAEVSNPRGASDAPPPEADSGMIRFSHNIFALPFALLSAILAWQSEPFRWLDLVGILLCMVFARSTAMAFNRLIDRRIDALNPRTQARHLPSGLLSVSSVWVFTLGCGLAFVASTLLFLLHDNPWPLYLSVPVLVFICCYSFTKRFTALCHAWLGASLLLSPVATWIAIRGLVALPTPVVLGLAVLFWVTGFDILYACQDVEFDKRAKLASIPARFGVPASLRIAAVAHFVMVIFLVALYWAAAPLLGWIYLAGIAAVAILLAYEHVLVRPDDLTRVNQAFFQVNGIISVGLLLLVVLQLAIGACTAQPRIHPSKGKSETK